MGGIFESTTAEVEMCAMDISMPLHLIQNMTVNKESFSRNNVGMFREPPKMKNLPVDHEHDIFKTAHTEIYSTDGHQTRSCFAHDETYQRQKFGFWKIQ
jgi:hypothetical protein